MLNGIHPVLIFRIKNIKALGDNFLTKRRGVIDTILSDFGLPIPVYLDPRLTGISVQDESKAIDIDTDLESVKDEITQKPKTIPIQKAANSLTNISMVAQKDSTALSVLFAFSEQIVGLAVDQGYSIDYYNGPIVVTGGLLRSLNTSVDPDTNLINVSLQLSKGTSLQAGAKFVELKASTGPKPNTGAQ